MCVSFRTWIRASQQELSNLNVTSRPQIHSHITLWCKEFLHYWLTRSHFFPNCEYRFFWNTSRYLLKWQERRHFMLWKILKRVSSKCYNLLLKSLSITYTGREPCCCSIWPLSPIRRTVYISYSYWCSAGSLGIHLFCSSWTTYRKYLISSLNCFYIKQIIGITLHLLNSVLDLNGSFL